MADTGQKSLVQLFANAPQPQGQPNKSHGPFGSTGSGPVLTKQERNLYRHHLHNLQYLDNGGGFTQPTGEVSTVLQMVVGPIQGKYYNIPSVWNGQQLDQDAAIQQAFGRSGHGPDYWPSYATPEEADDRYINQLHPLMERDVGRVRQVRK